MVTKEILVCEVERGRRHRKDLGDIDSLAKSIEDLGLLHPIVVTSELKLVAGERRLEAFKKLKREKIPARVIDIKAIALGELAENYHRKGFTPSEMVSIGEAVESFYRQQAKEAQQEAGKAFGRGKEIADIAKGLKPKDKAIASAKLAEPVSSRTERETRTRVATAVGTSHATYGKAKAVVEAAKAEPKKYLTFKEEMDRTGKVSVAFKKLQTQTRMEEVKAEPKLKSPSKLELLKDGIGKYRAIYIDPPWRYDDASCVGAAEAQYPTMSLEDICKLEVSELAHKDGSHLWLWTTWPLLREGAPHKLLEAWDFRWVGEMVWEKPGLGVGRWFRPATEILILAVKGKLHIARDNVRAIMAVPRGKHSEKPEEFAQLIESCSPGPYVELFARKERKGWDRWGNEA